MSTSATGPSGVETAAALLETELAQLEEQQAALQERQRAVKRELSGLAGRIESIRGALAALRAVPPATTTAGATEDQPDTTPTATEVLGSRFTDQVIAVLARDPGTALRARDVAEAIGRAQTSGTINAVRSTLDRLVATSRARRVGRGLYQAPAD
ncbi:hypothetical protein [Streptomyces sp. B93]|uniref:hypothetical protein n=1 Tax=Streptomyces sp. B93 TaxID=2824875 RepID=UPI001B380B3C|nr:hypothetical protein [Streptomyces sp. B93]MBQ1091925.1 hypothetical protein [Streptomyces sp. B93]